MSDLATDPYRIGVMLLDVEGHDPAAFHALVADAVARFEDALASDVRVQVAPFAFHGPHLTPGAGAYAPLDFLQIGIAEKLERRLPFLIIVTEVDLASSSLAYTLALPSGLTNVGVVSAKRLDPGFWGEPPDASRGAARLAALMLHTVGHLLNLRHDPHPDNVMYRLEGVEDLDRMAVLTAAQRVRLGRMLPREAHEATADGSRTARVAFVARVLVRDAGSIARAVRRANPLRLASRMPTMIAAGLSVIIVLLFGPETWDVSIAASAGQIGLFCAVSLAAAAFVLYRAFAFRTLLGRDRRLAESTVVTAAATLISLALTLVVLFVGFAVLMFVAVAAVFPDALMEAWPTVGEATQTGDHVRLALFLASMGVLAGSLGGRSDSRDLVRGVLFITEEE